MVQDLRSSEVGAFASAEYTGHRRSYLTRLEEFRQWDAAPLPVESPRGVVEAVRPVLQRALEADRLNRPALQFLRPDAAEDLNRLVAQVLAALAGVSPEAYRAQLPASARAAAPTFQANLATSLSAAESSIAVPAGDAPPQAWQDMFDELYAFHRGTGSDGHLAVAFVRDPQATRAALAVLPRGQYSQGLLKQRLSPEEWSRFHSVGAQSLPVFHQPPTGYDTARQQADRLVQAEVVLIVQTRSGDRFPVVIAAYYDPQTRAWWPLMVSRTTSLRALNSPTVPI